MIRVTRVLALREVLHEVDQPAVGTEDLLGSVALVDQLDLGALVEERELAQALGEDLAVELAGLGEDLGVGPEPDGGAGLRGRLALGELLRGLAPRVLLVPREPLALHVGVIRSDSAFTTDTPTPCRPPEMRVAAAAELAAGVAAW